MKERKEGARLGSLSPDPAPGKAHPPTSAALLPDTLAPPLHHGEVLPCPELLHIGSLPFPREAWTHICPSFIFYFIFGLFAISWAIAVAYGGSQLGVELEL